MLDNKQIKSLNRLLATAEANKIDYSIHATAKPGVIRLAIASRPLADPAGAVLDQQARYFCDVLTGRPSRPTRRCYAVLLPAGAVLKGAR